MDIAVRLADLTAPAEVVTLIARTSPQDTTVEATMTPTPVQTRIILGEGVVAMDVADATVLKVFWGRRAPMPELESRMVL